MPVRLHTWARRTIVLALFPLALGIPLAEGASAAARDRGATQDLEAIEDARLAPLRLVERVSVLVEDLTPDAARASLTREAIEAAAAARLRVAGLRVSPETASFPPLLYFQVSVLCNAGGLCALDVSSAVVQEVYLLKGAPGSSQAKTWSTGRLLLAPRARVAERVREVVREQADLFAADVLAARQRATRAAAPTTSNRGG